MADFRLLEIVFRYPDGKNEPTVPALQAIIDSNARDWLRWNFYVWFIWTNKETAEWYELLRAKVPQAHFLINRIDQIERHGWAEQWIWEWLNNKKPGKSPPGSLFG
jgi:hypothetical protein